MTAREELERMMANDATGITLELADMARHVAKHGESAVTMMTTDEKNSLVRAWPYIFAYVQRCEKKLCDQALALRRK